MFPVCHISGKQLLIKHYLKRHKHTTGVFTSIVALCMFMNVYIQGPEITGKKKEKEAVELKPDFTSQTTPVQIIRCFCVLYT